MKDINDAISGGISLEQIKRTAVPTYNAEQTNQEKRKLADCGIDLLDAAIDGIEHAKTQLDKIRIITTLQNELAPLVDAYMYRRSDLDLLLYQIRSNRGMAVIVTDLQRTIRREVKKSQRSAEQKNNTAINQAHNMGPKPEPHVLTLLNLKRITIQGEIVGFGAPEPTRINVERILRYDTRWKDNLKFCQFDGRVHIAIPKTKGEFVAVTDYYERVVQHWISETYGIELDDKTIGKIMDLVARDTPYHPVVEYLDNLEDWDGTHRLKNLFDYIDNPNAYFCIEESVEPQYIMTFPEEGEKPAPIWYPDFGIIPAKNCNRYAHIPQIFGVRFMVAHVARSKVMGCQQDILFTIVGNEGLKKTSALQILAVNPKWYSSTTFTIGKKDSFHDIQGKWLIELQEAQTLHQSGYNAAKAFITNRTDRFRFTYGRHSEDYPRGCMFWATTNERRLGFLNDPAGHRRHYLAEIEAIRFNKLEDDIEQLWAEALYYYSIDVNHWLTPEEEAARYDLVDTYRQVDSWEEALNQFCINQGAKAFWLSDALNYLGIAPKFQKQTEVNRCADILIGMGCYRGEVKYHGRKRVCQWHTPYD